MLTHVWRVIACVLPQLICVAALLLSRTPLHSIKAGGLGADLDAIASSDAAGLHETLLADAILCCRQA